MVNASFTRHHATAAKVKPLWLRPYPSLDVEPSLWIIEILPVNLVDGVLAVGTRTFLI